VGWQRFLSSVTGDLAWPAFLVFLILVFRTQIRALLERVKTLSYRDLRIEFDASTVYLDNAELQLSGRKIEEIQDVTEDNRNGEADSSEEDQAKDSDLDSRIDHEAVHVTLTEQPLISHPPLANWDELKELVSMDPRFAIHLAGEVLDGVTRKVSGKPHPFGSLAITRSMQRDTRIPESLVDGIVQLQRYRNLVEGNLAIVVAPHDAHNFIVNVQRSIALLESAIEQS
jgi:hypothetical protein